MTSVLDTYELRSYGLDTGNGVEQVSIRRRDGDEITSLAELQAVRDTHAPAARLLFVHLWLAHHPGAAADGDAEEGAHNGDRRARTAAANASAPSIAAPPSRRRRRGGGTLNLRDREITALAELIDDHLHIDDDSENADLLRAVRVKLARLPQGVTA